VPVALAGGVGATLAVLHTVLTRPLWYDEIWRPHFLAAPPAGYWSELAHANTPSALGWAVLTRAVGDLLGWHAWSLRVPELVALVALPAVAYRFIRRFAGPVAAGVAAACLGLSGVVIDLGTQLKPYSVEALASLVIVWLWLRAPGTDPWRRRLAWRTAAGLVALFSVPAAFLIIPLAALDVVSAGYGYWYGSWRVGWRHRLWAGLTAAPAVGICGLHTWLFVGHQSSQRASRFWDTQFLAGRGLGGGLRFVGVELVRIFGGAPTGVDRYDPNLVHPLTDPTFAAPWLLAPAAGLAFVAGVVTLGRGGRQGVHRTGNARRLADPRADEGRYVVAATLGALALALVASAGRYWPFGANRTNTFLVPLLVTVVATGADRLAHRAARPGAPWAGLPDVAVRLPFAGWVRLAGAAARLPFAGRLFAGGSHGDATESPGIGTVDAAPPADATHAPDGDPQPGSAPDDSPADGAGGRLGAAVASPARRAAAFCGTGWGAAFRGTGRAAFRGTGTAGARAALGAVVVVLVAAPLASASALRPLYRQRAELRPLALTVDATTQTRRLYQPGDVVVVGGRLARSGWLYAMDVSADRPYLASSRALSGAVGPRVPTAATVFLTAVGAGQARDALATRPDPRPRRLLLYVLMYDRAGTDAELASLHTAGWCPTRAYDYPNTGTLRVLDHC
jgi:hypothetical protein